MALAVLALHAQPALAQNTHTVNDETELNTALGSAVTGDTIQLDADFTLGAHIASTATLGLILDGNQRTINANGKAGFQFMGAGAGLAGIRNITIQGASRGGNGGAVYARSFTGGITGSTFAGNTAGSSGGAVFVLQNFTGGITGSTFTNNTATNGNGGAVFVLQNFTGGITGSTFTNNTSTNGRGVAVYVQHFTGDITNSAFTGNTAGDRGGAMYISQNATLTVPLGSTSEFYNNVDGSGPNSLFFGNFGDNKQVNMDVAGELLLHDPIAGQNNNLLFVKRGSGHLLLGGNNNLNRNGGTGSTWDIQAGRLTLTHDSAGNAGAINGTGSFTLGSNGAYTTLVTGISTTPGANTITANVINLNTGDGTHQTTLSFGLAGANAEATPTNANAILSLNASSALNMTGTGKLNIDLQSLNATNGNYTLLYNNSFAGDSFNTGNVNNIITLRGQSLGTNARLRDQMLLTINPESLVLQQSIAHAVGSWTNASGDGVWDINANNWSLQDEAGTTLAYTQHIAGDAARFGTASSSPPAGDQTITVHTGGVVVAGMVVDGSSHHTFNGGEIKIDTTASTLTDPTNATGELDKLGSGTLTLNNNFSGNVNIHAGQLAGHGQIAGLVTLKNGATIAPGNSIGTLTLGDIHFQSGSTYAFEANPDGTGDKIIATSTLGGGTAQIDAGANLNILAGAGTWNPSTSYTILEADGGVTGTFTNIATNLAFLTPTLNYSNPNQIGLALARNDVSFAGIGNTYNQKSTGFGIETLGTGNPIYNAVASMDANSARGVFDNLSGEIHASVKSAALTNSRYTRNAINQHLSERPLTNAKGLWVQTWYHDGHLKGDGNAQKLDNKGFGILLGADAYSQGATTLGVALGYEQSDLDASGTRRSSADMDAMHLMAYGRTQAGEIDIKGGIGYSWLDIDSKRHINTGSLQGTNKADYDGNLFQAYIEGSHTFDTPKADVIPYVNLAYQRVKTDSFTEKPGTNTQGTQLHHNGNSSNLFTSTIGVRGNWDLNATSMLYADLGWQHSFGSNAPKSKMNFIGGQSYTIKGVETNRNAAVIGLGANFHIKHNMRLSFGYEGLLGNQSRDHGARLLWEMDF